MKSTPHRMSCHARVLQINVSNGGMPKLPIPEGEVTRLGLTNDRHAHPHIHGGERKALLLVTSEGIEELKDAGFPLFHGALGENVTTVGIDRRSVYIGQRYRIGEIVVEITKVRSPCEQLSVYGFDLQSAVYDPDVKAGNLRSPRWGLSGFYASVTQAGTIRTGDPITLLDALV
jgi:MOSC domain-containing protein YiiM